jgi:hypothetical protein
MQNDYFRAFTLVTFCFPAVFLAGGGGAKYNRFAPTKHLAGKEKAR